MADEQFDFASCEDEEQLVALLGKTNDNEKRKAIRDRLKEIRSHADALREERRKQREAMGNVDSIQTKLAAAEAEKARKLKAMETTTKTEIDTVDSVKAQMARADDLKADQMKYYDEIAKEGGSSGYQGGLESVKKLEQEFAEKDKERLLQSFNEQRKKELSNVQEADLAPRAKNVIVDAKAVSERQLQ